MGYGADKRMKTNSILELSSDMPLVIEIADKPEMIEKLLPFLEESVAEGFVTLESVHVYKFRKR